MRPALTSSRREGGFTLIELLIVMIIIGILLAAAWVAMQSAKVQSRNDAMKAAAASVDAAIGTFNRMYPRVGAGATDALLRGPNPWVGNTGNPSQGLADETGEWILAEFPSNPYRSNTNVRVFRYAVPQPCAAVAGGAPGDIRVCRMGGANGALTYTIRAYGRNTQNQTVTVYTASHGTRSR